MYKQPKYVTVDGNLYTRLDKDVVEYKGRLYYENSKNITVDGKNLATSTFIKNNKHKIKNVVNDPNIIRWK